MLRRFIKWLYDRRSSPQSIMLESHGHEPHFTRPRIHQFGNAIFLVLILLLVMILFDDLTRSFAANPFLNGLIIFVLLLGIVKSFAHLRLINREIDWLNQLYQPQGAAGVPHILAPLASYLRSRLSKSLPLSASFDAQARLMGSIAGRLDEERATSRYMTGLLVFLGLLGTFWGLLQTVGSVGDTIRSLDIKSNDAGVVFDTLRGGLQAPLSGMATAFASSLFGLAGSLVLGFLDMQSGKAQARFLDDMEQFIGVLGEDVAESPQAYPPAVARGKSSGEDAAAEAEDASRHGERAAVKPAYGHGRPASRRSPMTRRPPRLEPSPKD